MLKIQEFILNHDDWYDLLQQPPYSLKISEDDGFYLFMYRLGESDFNEEICREARGLILNSQEMFRPVRMAFRKFFNLGEPYADEIDWETSSATEKIDGSLMSLWYARGGWHLSTNGTIDAYKAPLNNGGYETFGKLFDAAAKNWNIFTFNEFNKNYCYTFELVSPFNQIVISYDKPELFLILVRDMNTLYEVEISPRKLREISRPKKYVLPTANDYGIFVEALANEDDILKHEGIVVKDCLGRRVKIKTEKYIQMHHAVNNGNLTLERAIDIIKANEADEFLTYFSQYTNYFDIIRAVLSDNSKNLSQIKFEVECWKMKHPEGSKKDFALHIKNSKYLAYYFACYDNKEQQFINNLSTKKFIQMFEIDKQIKKEF